MAGMVFSSFQFFTFQEEEIVFLIFSYSRPARQETSTEQMKGTLFSLFLAFSSLMEC